MKRIEFINEELCLFDGMYFSKEELKKYHLTKSIVSFKTNEKLPKLLIKRLVKESLGVIKKLSKTK